ncbi:MAG: ATP-grasp domain-containing protein, partial [Candidatus Micrarchaeota archaeon]
MTRVALLDDSFVSEILLEFLKENGIPVFAEGELGEQLAARGIRILRLEETRERLSKEGCDVYSNSERFVPLISRHYANRGSTDALRLFKNKADFRKALADLFPSFYFREVLLKEAKAFKVPGDMDLILKPTVGFWSVGIRRFSGQSEYSRAMGEALTEIDGTKGMFDSDIIGSSSFLVEENIRGEEFACDAYFDNSGSPVVLGLYCHHFRDEEDVRDLVYYTGKKIVEKTLGKVEKFL